MGDRVGGDAGNRLGNDPTDRVDVVAFDAYESLPDDERKHRQAVAVATYVVVAVVVAGALVRGRLLLGVLGAAVVLGAWQLLFREDRPITTTYRAVEAGRGEAIVRAHEVEARKRDRMRTFLLMVVAAAVIVWGVLEGSLLVAVVGGGAVGGLAVVAGGDPLLPRVVEADVDRERADELFELVDGHDPSGPDGDR